MRILLGFVEFFYTEVKLFVVLEKRVAVFTQILLGV